MNKKVLRLDISVNNVLTMAELDSLQQLVDVLADEDLIDAVRIFLKDLEQVLFQVLEDQIQTVAPIHQESDAERGCE